MLVLTRRREEWIFIGDGDSQIRIMVVDIRGDRVRIGVEAPHHVKVHRKEIWLEIQQGKPPHIDAGVTGEERAMLLDDDSLDDIDLDDFVINCPVGDPSCTSRDDESHEACEPFDGDAGGLTQHHDTNASDLRRLAS